MHQYSWSDILFYAGIVLVGTLTLGWVWYTNASLSVAPPNAGLVPQISNLAPDPTPIFSDVDLRDPAFPAVMSLVRQGIIQGYQDQTFRPNAPTNRSEALKALLKSSPIESGDIFDSFQTYIAKEKDLPFVAFPDVKPTDWFAPYVFKGYTIGIISGNPTGEYEAYRPIMLSEFLKMLLVMERENIIADDAREIPFEQVPAHAWYTPYFVRAKEMGLLPLDEEDIVNPSAELTRGYMTRLLFKYMNLRHAQ
ncbi:hypothetical protein COW46_00315 [Candidatus Gracilibacteria bacterium CG17_big_fil_post_rev_8_21_14_2_50_48_13]|nr:MAG: hypothetical protein COW46_00315 [Candidatus Gracilibacteria bacterium CG17_big_fil_post_rev_8_21_14_2_50_48_13]